MPRSASLPHGQNRSSRRKALKLQNVALLATYAAFVQVQKQKHQKCQRQMMSFRTALNISSVIHSIQIKVATAMVQELAEINVLVSSKQNMMKIWFECMQISMIVVILESSAVPVHCVTFNLPLLNGQTKPPNA